MLTLEQKNLIMEMSKKGASTVEIANATGINRHTVARYLEESHSSREPDSFSIKEVDVINRELEKFKASMPSLAKSMEKFEAVRKEAEKNGIFLLSKTEYDIVKQIRDLQDPVGSSQSQKLVFLKKFIRYIANEYTDDAGSISADKLDVVITDSLELNTLIRDKGVTREGLSNFVDMLIWLNQAELEGEDYRTLGEFITSTRKTGFDLKAFLRKNQMNEIVHVLRHNKELKQENVEMDKNLASLQYQEKALLQRNQKLANIEDLGREQYRLLQQRENLALEISEMEKLRDALQTYLQTAMTVGELTTKVKELSERKEILSEEVMVEERRLNDLKRECASLEKRVDYYRSEAFISDIAIDMFAGILRNNPAFHGELPLAIRKYLGLMGDFGKHSGQNTSMDSRGVQSQWKRMRPGIA